MKNLIVTVAADSKEDGRKMPHLFTLTSEGLMYCVGAITGLNLDDFDHLYFTVLEKHNKLYYVEQMLNIQFERLGISEKAKVVVLENPTRNQPETIYQTLIKEHIEGSLFCKDGDSYFACETPEENSVAVYALDKMTNVNPQHKSYVALDEMFYITNIIEKRILGNLFSAGGYYFDSTIEFCKYFRLLEKFEHLYLSHLIYCMLLDKKIFRPVKVSGYIDWGG